MASRHGSACFEISLPFKRFTEERPQTQQLGRLAVLNKLMATQSVLLVEDDAVLRKLQGNQLRKRFSRHATAVVDGTEAVTAITEGSVDLVLIDYFMPGLDGRDLIAHLRQQGDQTPVIALTAATIGDEMALLTDAGADIVLSKPLNLPALEEALIALARADRLHSRSLAEHRTPVQ